jgi:hypothetical protein
MTAFFYKQIRKREGLDNMSIKQLNEYLDLRLELSNEEWKLRRKNEEDERNSSEPLRNDQSG